MEHRHDRQHRIRDVGGQAFGRGRHHRMQDVRAMRVEHALGIAGGARGVAEPGGGALVELLPAEIVVDLADPVLVGDGVLEPGRRHVRGVGQDDVALDRRQMVGDRLEQRHEGEVGHHDPVLGVIDDPGDLLGKQARIDGVVDRADAGDAVPGLEMAVAVPGERRDPVAELDRRRARGAWRPSARGRGSRGSSSDASALRPCARRLPGPEIASRRNR